MFRDNDCSYILRTGRLPSAKPLFHARRPRIKFKPKDIDTYYFPAQIADEIGFSANYINNLKRFGCHFHGRKTTIRHVRTCLAKKEEEDF
jgi:hypothetical protein